MKKGLALALTLTLISSAAFAQVWTPLRPMRTSQQDLPQILVDASSIQVVGPGLRRATSKVDFLVGSGGLAQHPPGALSFIIFVKIYDCERRLEQEESHELHLVSGATTASHVKGSKWYPVPEIDAADPAYAFTCAYSPK